MYRSGLVPRRMALFGLVGGPLVCASGIAVMFGAFDAGSAPRFIATISEIIWEAVLGIYLTFKGFKASSVVFDESRDTGRDAGLAIAASCGLPPHDRLPSVEGRLPPALHARSARLERPRTG